ncbi:MAG: DUF4132 domain-containing protein [Pseudomonadota bacterium]
MSIIDKIFGKFSSGVPGRNSALNGAQIGQLKQAFAPLEAAGAAVPEKALAFITDGSQEDVLLDLQAAQAQGLGERLGTPGRLRWTHASSASSSAAKKQTDASLTSRAQFYCEISATAPPLASLVRLGKLLAAADAGQRLDHPGSPAPAWLQYLVNDAVFATFNEYKGQKDLSKSRSAWGIALFAQLLAEDELDPTLALALVFERKDLASYYHDHLDGITNPLAVADFLRAQRDATEALPATLSADGRLVLARRIGSDAALLLDFEALFVRLAVDASKAVRQEAAQHIGKMQAPRREALLTDRLTNGSTTERTQAAELLARLPGDQARACLAAALEGEASKPVQQAIRSALTRLDAAGDASALELPEPAPWQSYPDTPLGDDALALLKANLAELTERSRVAAEKERNDDQAKMHNWTWAQKRHDEVRKLREDDLHKALRVLNGQGKKNDVTRSDRALVEVVDLGHKLLALPSFGVPHLLRWLAASRDRVSFWWDPRFQQWLKRQPLGSVDLRALGEVGQRAGLGLDSVASAALQSHWQTTQVTDLLPAERIWPFFAEHPEFIDEGLGLVAPVKGEDAHWRSHRFEFDATLRVLKTFPTILPRWLPQVMAVALAEGKTHRAAAQQALSSLPDIGHRVAESLDHSKSEVRIEAANWLANLKDPTAVAPLTRALDKETRETVRAACLTALEALGDDISARLTPATLLTEARKGLKGKPPTGLAWFAFDALPACRWADGTAVDSEIVRWWVILACKLKEPGGNALLTRYLGLLDAASRQALGLSVLQQFIAHDTRHPSLDEGIAHAQRVAPPRWQDYQRCYQSAKPEYRHYYEVNFQKTTEQVFEECKREKMREYLGSAIGEKGVLALAAFAPGQAAVALLQQYMRDHYARRSQIEAMLDGLASGNDPVVIQLLLGISRRYRTLSVQTRAKSLVQDIAARNQWTSDQLADRTIPTAGLDETGVLALAYGERVFTLRLDAAMKPELRNPEGKGVKALPEPRQNDDPALVKEAKAQLSASKKEVKQVIDLQTARLSEAMCTGRVWPQAEWREYLHRHPIAGRLLQRLVWIETTSQGGAQRLFRPTEDGSLINAQDEEVELAEDSGVCLAHASLVGKAAAEEWTKHFKDYKVVPLFPQMTRPSLSLPFKDAHGQDVTEIADRQGWVSDTFTLRGAFNKLSYQRGQAEDGGFFYFYGKEYAGVGVRVVIQFSGNVVPEENVPAALKTLAFEDMSANRWSSTALALSAVPPVLLAEAYADYLAVAEVCAGFDAEWEKKTPW